MRENRIKILHIDPDQFLHLLNWRHGLPQYMQSLKIDMPEDAHVERIVANSWRNTIDLVISHPSFDLVPAGQMAPDVVSWDTEVEILDVCKLTVIKRCDRCEAMPLLDDAESALRALANNAIVMDDEMTADVVRSAQRCVATVQGWRHPRGLAKAIEYESALHG